MITSLEQSKLVAATKASASKFHDHKAKTHKIQGDRLARWPEGDTLVALRLSRWRLILWLVVTVACRWTITDAAAAVITRLNKATAHKTRLKFRSRLGAVGLTGSKEEEEQKEG